MEVFVDDDSKLTLHGLRQHYVKLRDNQKNRQLFELLDVLEFNQVTLIMYREGMLEDDRRNPVKLKLNTTKIVLPMAQMK